MNRRNLIIAGLFLAALVAVFILMRGKPGTAPEEDEAAETTNVVELGTDAQRNIGLEVVEVQERMIRRMVRATGIVSPDQARVAHVFPLARGIAEEVYVQLGDRVRQGQRLLTYDNIELGQLIGEYLSLLGEQERLRAQEGVARKFLDRARALIEVEAIAQREFELRQAEYEQAKAAAESKRADLARVEEQLHRFGLSDENIKALGGSDHGPHRTASHNVLRAPRDGVVTAFDVSQGELVDQGKELFTIVDTSTVWVLADVYEKDLGQVGSGGDCDFTVAAYPGEVFSGRITYVSDFLDPKSRTAKLRCVVPNRDRRLKLEMFAVIEIPSVEQRTAMAVPAAALQHIGDETVVFVQRDLTHFEKRVVAIDERGEDWLEVLTGVQDREKVVTKGSFHLKSIVQRELIGGEE
ncbi:MAG: efflux RND transporter periplasmic adaptor subunit [Acidobacteriota bacterium]